MKVSIIIPVYNVAPYIKRCLDSVVAQTFQDIECILVDDCGTDNSVEIAQQYIKNYQGQIHFKFIHHENNLGLSGARNTGIRIATSEWLFFLDSDDAITPECLSTLLALKDKHPDADFVQGNLLDERGIISHYGFYNISEYYNNSAAIEEIMLNRVITSAWNRLIKRSLLIEKKIFFPVGMIHEDMYWVYFLSKYVHAAAFTTIGTYIYYTNDDSIMTSVNQTTKIKRYTSRLNASEAYLKDILSNNYKSHIRHQYLAVNLLSCLTELVPLKSFKHWMRFWGYILHIGCSNIRKFSLNRFLFLVVLLPPVCFISGSNKYRWRVQNGIISNI
ncbi:MAG: glycosyltransferase [Paludibacteraceae bacterium]|nr:glycosyltransferase [Paludibacteraceae bacterium]